MIDNELASPVEQIGDPAQVNELGGPQTMPEGQHVLCRLNQPLGLALGQMLAGPIGGVGPPYRQSNCAFYVGRTNYLQMPNGRHFPPLPAMAGRSYNSQSRPVLARPSVSNAVALADISRCPVVVADQAAGQKDAEADLWVRVSAV